MTLRRVTRSAAVALAVFLLAPALWRVSAQDLKLPNASGSVKFAVIGDSGSGSREQFEVGAQMAKYRGVFKYDRVIMLGDNIYGGQTPADLDKKFAQPYKALINAGVKFSAALGNHDSQENRKYKPFGMDGQRYYTYTMDNVRFFVLDTDQLDPAQMKWFEDELKKSQDAKDEWKICYFHHPLYSSGGTHGSDLNLRVVLEPLFVKYGMNVVFAGHDHIYERMLPQKGIYYFVSGNAGQLRKGDFKRAAFTAAGYDQDMTFMLIEISKTSMAFQCITRTGQVIDSGVLPLQVRPQP